MTIVPPNARETARKGRDFLRGLCTCTTCERAAMTALPAAYAAWCAHNDRPVPAEVLDRLTLDTGPGVPPWAVLGVDLGKRTDHSAVALLIPDSEDGYRFTSVNRLPLATGRTASGHYLTQARRIAAAVRKVLAATVGPLLVLVDSTGVGDAVIEMIGKELPKDRRVDLVSVVITGGRDATHRHGRWTISKTALVDPLVAALEQEEVTFADFPDRHVVRRELLAYRVKPASVEAGPDRLEAERQSDHDDCVIACAMALYAARRTQPVITRSPTRALPVSRTAGLYRRRIG